MIIRNISLENFRNYGRLDLDVGPSVNIVCGNNAQGKTNLVEAISVCSCITSHRTSKDRDLIKSGENGYKICLEFDGSGYYGSVASLENQYLTEKSPLNNSGKPRRQLKIDGLLTTHTNEYLGHCNTVIFAPEDLNIVKGAPQHRRKFLNMLISKVSPSYYDLIARMNRCIIQKTALIKSYRGNDAYIRNDDFDFWDITMADLSSEIIIKRMRFVNMISKKASEHHSVISDGREVLSVSYVGMPFYREIEDHLKEKGLIEGFYAENMDENVYLEVKMLIDSYLRAAFRKSRKNDIEKGICTIGIHRDDIDIKLNGMVMRTYCSQGQQRSAALALKLAELEILRKHYHSSPVLLLDDVFSELDKGRRMGLLAGMDNAQIFITCTDREYIEKELDSFLLKDVEPAFFRVMNGTVERES